MVGKMVGISKKTPSIKDEKCHKTYYNKYAP